MWPWPPASAFASGFCVVTMVELCGKVPSQLVPWNRKGFCQGGNIWKEREERRNTGRSLNLRESLQESAPARNLLVHLRIISQVQGAQCPPGADVKDPVSCSEGKIHSDSPIGD